MFNLIEKHSTIKNILILLVCLFFFSCEKKKDIEIEGSHCFNKKNNGWYIDKEYKNELMLVVKQEISENTYYFLRPSLSSSFIDLVPCNLPIKYQDENLALKISGRSYNNPLIDMLGRPFEITKIELIEPS